MLSLRHSAPMTTARIIEQDRKTTQSGKAKAGQWVLEIERQQAQIGRAHV